MTCPVGPAICRYRGDTYPWTFTIKDENDAVIDITSFTFKLTVDPNLSPRDATDNLFVLTGAVTDGPNGVVQFDLSAAQADQPGGIYYYDLEWVDTSSKIRTIAKSTFEFREDVTKP